MSALIPSAQLIVERERSSVTRCRAIRIVAGQARDTSDARLLLSALDLDDVGLMLEARHLEEHTGCGSW